MLLFSVSLVLITSCSEPNISVNNEFYFIVKENEAYINYDEKVFIVNCENEKLISILSDKNVKKNSFDIKSLMHRGFEISGDFSDIGIKAYVCDPKYGFADFFKIFSLLDFFSPNYCLETIITPSIIVSFVFNLRNWFGKTTYQPRQKRFV